jgi:hypothetical protein
MVPVVPFPLPPELPLTAVLTCAARAAVLPDLPLGVWLRGGSRRAFLRINWNNHRRLLILSPDLGSLLNCCAWIVVRIREPGRAQVRAVSVDDLILTRALRVVTALPYLPAAGMLRSLFPDLCGGPGGIEVPLAYRSPEEVLAACAAARVPVAGSRVVYRPAASSQPAELDQAPTPYQRTWPHPPVRRVAERPVPSG